MNNKVVKNVNGQVGEGVGFERIRRMKYEYEPGGTPAHFFSGG